MTLQQMRYLIVIAECGSISAAAQALFVSQPSLSGALKEVERETGVSVFRRTNHGVEPTPEGLELLAMVRQVVQMDDMIAARYGRGGEGAAEFLSVSGQRYSFVTEAFAALMRARSGSRYSFALRETDTREVIDDVRALRSELGVLCLTSLNRGVIMRELDRAGLAFELALSAAPRLLVRAQHPLCARSSVRLEELEPYPRVVFDQGGGASAFYSEEPLPEAPFCGSIAVRDRSSIAAVLNLTDAYTIATGLRTQGMDEGVITVPLATDERMEIGCIRNPRIALSDLAREFLSALQHAAACAQH